MLRVFALALLLVSLTACYAANAQNVMADPNARGCVYVRASAMPLASGGLILVGTWGADPPAYADCFNGLPIIP